MNQDGFLAPGEKERMELTQSVKRRVQVVLQHEKKTQVCTNCKTHYTPLHSIGKRECAFHPLTVNTESEDVATRRRLGTRAWRGHYRCCGEPVDARDGTPMDHMVSCSHDIRYRGGYGLGGNPRVSGCVKIDHTSNAQPLQPIRFQLQYHVRFGAEANALSPWVRVEPQFVVERILVERGLPLDDNGAAALFGGDSAYKYVGDARTIIQPGGACMYFHVGGLRIKVSLRDAYIWMTTKYRMPNNVIRAANSRVRTRKRARDTSNDGHTKSIIQRISNLAHIKKTSSTSNGGTGSTDDSSLLQPYVFVHDRDSFGGTQESVGENGGRDEANKVYETESGSSPGERIRKHLLGNRNAKNKLQDDTSIHYDAYYDPVPTKAMSASTHQIAKNRASLDTGETVSRIIPMEKDTIAFYPFYIWFIADEDTFKVFECDEDVTSHK